MKGWETTFDGASSVKVEGVLREKKREREEEMGGQLEFGRSCPNHPQSKPVDKSLFWTNLVAREDMETSILGRLSLEGGRYWDKGEGGSEGVELPKLTRGGSHGFPASPPPEIDLKTEKREGCESAWICRRNEGR